MFKKSVKSILATLTLAAGATLAVPAAAEWPGNSDYKGGIYIGNSKDGVHIGSSFINEPHKQVGHRHHKPRHHGYHYRKHSGHKGHCGPRRALRKAWKMGLNQPHIARINKRKIVVIGYNYGHSAKVVFDRYGRYCRVIKTRGLY